MQQPDHLRSFQAPQASSRRIVSFGFVVLFHVFVIYAFATGLANQLVQKMPEVIKAEVVKEVIPTKPPPPPPPPDLAKPPPPFVPPPEITIQTEAPPTNTITVQNKVATPPPKEVGITAPASIGAPHTCAQDRWYPPIALRLNQEGNTTVKFTINTDGSVSDAAVADSSGHDSLDQAAVRCVSTWHYKPAMQNGAPVVAPWQTVIKWQIR
ncbi:MAG TPA: energy transducer TonB [Rhizomicrobium sp.]|nr:energy transducer TonB [Rhizomicrobium sp.]